MPPDDFSLAISVDELLENLPLLSEFLSPDFDPLDIEPWLCKCPSYRLLRVTAVLTATDDMDPDTALGRVVDGKVIPREGYPRNTAIHTEPDQNYIRDAIRLANLQLLKSGACFGLDVENLAYVLEPNTFLHERECWDSFEDHEKTCAFLAKKAQDPAPDNPYRDSVLLIYRWGKNPHTPSLQGCAWVGSPYILMPGQYRDWPMYLDGKPRWGNHHLTHEFGHFMGLAHPFTGITLRLMQLADLGGRNPRGFPLTTENLPHMQGVTEQELQSTKAQAPHDIATWPYSLEADTGGDPVVGIPDAYGIQDTPIDIGFGLPLIEGQWACTGTYQYTLKRYDAEDLEKVEDWWDVEEGVTPDTFEEHVVIDDVVRSNIMNYWPCTPPLSARFSADQVERMGYVLAHIRPHLVGRIVETVPCEQVQFIPPSLKKLLRPPWHEWPPSPLEWFKRMLARVRFPRYWEMMTQVARMVPAYAPWQPAQLRSYLESLERAGKLARAESAMGAALALWRAEEAIRAHAEREGSV
jgi:hypothetical protein